MAEILVCRWPTCLCPALKALLLPSIQDAQEARGRWPLPPGVALPGSSSPHRHLTPAPLPGPHAPHPGHEAVGCSDWTFGFPECMLYLNPYLGNRGGKKAAKFRISKKGSQPVNPDASGCFSERKFIESCGKYSTSLDTDTAQLHMSSRFCHREKEFQ